MSSKFVKILACVAALCFIASNGGGPSGCEFYQDFFNNALVSFLIDIELMVNKTVNNMNLYVAVNSSFPLEKFNKGLRDTQSVGTKSISDKFATFEDVIGGLTGVSHAFLESVFFDDEPNNKFPLSCIVNIQDAKDDLHHAYTALGNKYNELSRNVE